MIVLDAARSLRVERGACVRITCAAGVVWITQEGDIRDLFLGSGDVLFLSPRGVALVTALEPALLRVEDQSAIARGTTALARVLRAWGGWMGRRLATLVPWTQPSAELILRR